MTERLDRVEPDITQIKGSISELRSTVATLAEVAGIHDRQIEQLIQSQQDSQRRFDQYIEQAERDRSLMLRLIESIAQGRNGG